MKSNTMIPRHHDDPMQLLMELRSNRRLEVLDLSTAVDWDGANSDQKASEYDDESLIGVPLILQSSSGGRSVAFLLTPVPSSHSPQFKIRRRKWGRMDDNNCRSKRDECRPQDQQ